MIVMEAGASRPGKAIPPGNWAALKRTVFNEDRLNCGEPILPNSAANVKFQWFIWFSRKTTGTLRLLHKT